MFGHIFIIFTSVGSQPNADVRQTAELPQSPQTEGALS